MKSLNKFVLVAESDIEAKALAVECGLYDSLIDESKSQPKDGQIRYTTALSRLVSGDYCFCLHASGSNDDGLVVLVTPYDWAVDQIYGFMERHYGSAATKAFKSRNRGLS